jgi:hypothetical protein
MPAREGTYGLLAEFDTPGDLIRAARQARLDGWRRMDCYTPYPVEEAAEAIGFHRNKVPLITLVGGLMGLTAMFLLEVWISVLAYPLNIGGRPLYSWPAFIVPAYEWTILWAGLSAAFGIIRCSMRRISAMGRQQTSFSCAWRHWTRSSTWWKQRLTWKAFNRFRWRRWRTDDQGSEIRDQGSEGHPGSVPHTFAFFLAKA